MHLFEQPWKDTTTCGAYWVQSHSHTSWMFSHSSNLSFKQSPLSSPTCISLSTKNKQCRDTTTCGAYWVQSHSHTSTHHNNGSSTYVIDLSSELLLHLNLHMMGSACSAMPTTTNSCQQTSHHTIHKTPNMNTLKTQPAFGSTRTFTMHGYQISGHHTVPEKQASNKFMQCSSHYTRSFRYPIFITMVGPHSSLGHFSCAMHQLTQNCHTV